MDIHGYPRISTDIHGIHGYLGFAAVQGVYIYIIVYLYLYLHYIYSVYLLNIICKHIYLI